MESLLLIVSGLSALTLGLLQSSFRKAQLCSISRNKNDNQANKEKAQLQFSTSSMFTLPERKSLPRSIERVPYEEDVNNLEDTELLREKEKLEKRLKDLNEKLLANKKIKLEK
jgi:hypothetical protein